MTSPPLSSSNTWSVVQWTTSSSNPTVRQETREVPRCGISTGSLLIPRCNYNSLRVWVRCMSSKGMIYVQRLASWLEISVSGISTIGNTYFLGKRARMDGQPGAYTCSPIRPQVTRSFHGLGELNSRLCLSTFSKLYWLRTSPLMETPQGSTSHLSGQKAGSVTCVEGRILLSSYLLLTAVDAALALLSIMGDAALRKETVAIGLRELSGAGGIMTYVAIVSWCILWNGCSLQMSFHNSLLIASSVNR